MLDLNTRQDAQASTVVAKGEIDLESAPELLQKLTPLFKSGGAVRVDLAGVAYMDSTGVAVLVQALKLGQKSGAAFRLVSPSERVQAVLSLARLDQVFDIESEG
ncbi:MAG: STAS domain-containing protein [Planctomycetota bacterium]